jgi:hypothetical protein
MKITVEIDLHTNDGSTPLIDDVARAFTKQVNGLELSWNDPSLGRALSANMVVLDVFRS